MKSKLPAIISVIFLVVASLLVAGCTTSTTNTTDQTPSASATPSTSTATHDAFLEKYIVEDKNTTSNTFGNITSWKVTWINSTSARVEWVVVNKTGNETATMTINDTYTLFPTTQDATQYLDAMNKTGYTITSGSGNYSQGTYKTVTSSAPAVFKAYVRFGEIQNNSMPVDRITQQDKLIEILTGTIVTT
jgi:hypothetical protein